MTSIPQQNYVFSDDRMPSRGFFSDFIQLMTHPIVFFRALRRKQNAHALIVAILILASLVVYSLQSPEMSDAGSSPVADPMMFDGPPADPGFMPGEPGAPSSGDNVTVWITALSSISIQLMTWLAMTAWLAPVTMYGGNRPRFGKNLQIVIWSTVPLALMVGLQIAYVTGGETISAAGLSGFLDEFSWFSKLSLPVQSFVHALASQITIFWIWHLALIYLGARYTLRGKRRVILFVIISWVISLSMVTGINSYRLLKDQQPEPAVEEPLIDDMPLEDEQSPDSSGLVDSEMQP